MIFKTIPYKSHDWYSAVKLRESILRIPLGSQFTPTELEEEKDHIHIAGYVDKELVATAVLVPENKAMKMQRVVVSKELRNNNIGSKMMTFCEQLVKDKGVEMLYCHARDSAVNFYKKNNYFAEGDYFEEDGIPHLKMIKNL